MIAAGKLRHRIAIQRPPVAKDARGQLSGDWVELGGAWSEIKELTGSERDTARQKLAKATHRILIRYLRKFTVTTNHRIEFRGRFFQIGHVDNLDEINSVWKCLAVEEKI